MTPEDQARADQIRARADAATCPKWGARGHNEVVLRGTVLWWRRYATCVACGAQRRIGRKETGDA